MARVFISYHGPDHETVDQIDAALRSDGHDVFYARRTLKPGDDLIDIAEQIPSADYFVFCHPADGKPSPWMKRELGIAWETEATPGSHLRILPAHLGKAEPLEILRARQSADFSSGTERGIASLQEAIAGRDRQRPLARLERTPEVERRRRLQQCERYYLTAVRRVCQRWSSHSGARSEVAFVPPEVHKISRGNDPVVELSELLRPGARAVVFGRSGEDEGVHCSWMALGNRGHIVAGCTEGANDRRIAALVGEKTHWLLSRVGGACADKDNFLVGERVGRITHRRLDVLPCHTRVGLQEVCVGRTLAQLPKNQLDGNPCPANDRLTKHHVGVDIDPVRQRHWIL